MALISINVPNDLLAAFKAASERAERNVSAQIRFLMVEFVAKSAPQVKPLTAAQTTKAKEAVMWASIKARFTTLLTDGDPGWPGEKIEPSQIRMTFRENTPAVRAKYEAVLREVMAELGITEHAPAPPAVAPPHGLEVE